MLQSCNQDTNKCEFCRTEFTADAKASHLDCLGNQLTSPKIVISEIISIFLGNIFSTISIQLAMSTKKVGRCSCKNTAVGLQKSELSKSL